MPDRLDLSNRSTTATRDGGFLAQSGQCCIVTSRPLDNVVSLVSRLDNSGLRWIAGHRTVVTDTILQLTGSAADRSGLWVAVAMALWTRGTPRARRAALEGLAAITTTSVIANGVLKPLIRRRRPAVSANLRKTGPTKSSFPSGHAASATAFAVTVGGLVPPLRLPLALTAAAVGYSRIHEKRHYPSDVMGGSLVGAVAAGIVMVTARRIRRTP